jgi:hypothetical protein
VFSPEGPLLQTVSTGFPLKVAITELCGIMKSDYGFAYVFYSIAILLEVWVHFQIRKVLSPGKSDPTNLFNGY